MKSFTPKFDVKEKTTVYELYGELPGIDRHQINIEFVDADTLTITGKIERLYSSDVSSTKAGAIEPSSTPTAIKDKASQPTIEDEDAASTTATIGSSTDLATTSDNNTSDFQNKIKEEKEQEESTDKFWVSERSVGEFARSFTFAVKINQEAVTASMRNGVLSIVVPKGTKVDLRRITIN